MVNANWVMLEAMTETICPAHTMVNPFMPPGLFDEECGDVILLVYGWSGNTRTSGANATDVRMRD
jgi:hypothetical protein